MRRATCTLHSGGPWQAISIHALLAESDALHGRIIGPDSISIHALLAESDSQWRTLASGIYDFYPRSPCGERHRQRKRHSHALDFYPRSPCGERLPDGILKGDGKHISIHALLAESDQLRLLRRAAQIYFYPRSPCGERLSACWRGCWLRYISIHALLAESDTFCRCRVRPK